MMNTLSERTIRLKQSKFNVQIQPKMEHDLGPLVYSNIRT